MGVAGGARRAVKPKGPSRALQVVAAHVVTEGFELAWLRRSRPRGSSRRRERRCGRFADERVTAPLPWPPLGATETSNGHGARENREAHPRLFAARRGLRQGQHQRSDAREPAGSASQLCGGSRVDRDRVRRPRRQRSQGAPSRARRAPHRGPDAQDRRRGLCEAGPPRQERPPPGDAGEGARGARRSIKLWTAPRRPAGCSFTSSARSRSSSAI